MILRFDVDMDLLCIHRIRPSARRILDGFHVLDLADIGVTRHCLSLRNDGGLRKFTRAYHADETPLQTIARALGGGHVLRAAAGGVDHHRGPVAADDAQHGAGLTFIKAPQAHGGDLMFAAEAVAVLDEIEAETTAVAFGIPLVAPCRRPSAVEIGLGGMRGKDGRAGDQSGQQVDDGDGTQVRHDGVLVWGDPVTLRPGRSGVKVIPGERWIRRGVVRA